jgi:CheY-like chemotaxis protein
MANRADDLKAVALLRLAIVEKVTLRLNDALRLLMEAAPILDKSGNHSLRGRFHSELTAVLVMLGEAERRSDYTDRALIEAAAASYHFEQAGHRRYQACMENNLGMLFCTVGRYSEAHEHLDRAQALFTGMKDVAHIAQVDDTRARVLLAEGRVAAAEKLVRSAVKALEKGGQQSLLADDALVADGVRIALEDEGWSVETCGDGTVALEKLARSARYDVLIFDNQLADTSGIELLRQTRGLAHRQQTPVIILSASDVEMQTRRAGANAFLRKPDDLPALTETVARLLARRK